MLFDRCPYLDCRLGVVGVLTVPTCIIDEGWCIRLIDLGNHFQISEGKAVVYTVTTYTIIFFY